MLLRIFVLIGVVRILTTNLSADNSAQNPPIQNWQSSPEGIDFSIVNISAPGNGGSIVTISIKNTSTTEMWCPVGPGNPNLIRLFLIDKHGIKHRIHDPVYHAKAPFPGETPQEAFLERIKVIESLSGSAQMGSLQPGQIKTVIEVLTAQDLALIKSQPIQFSFSVFDKSHHFDVESKPRNLDELAASPVEK